MMEYSRLAVTSSPKWTLGMLTVDTRSANIGARKYHVDTLVKGANGKFIMQPLVYVFIT